MGKSKMRYDGKTYVEKDLEDFFCGLLLEAFRLFSTEDTRYFALLDLVEHGHIMFCQL
jgi:hypothetical protein